MQASIKSFSSDDEYYIDEGCHIIELSNSPDEAEVSIARARCHNPMASSVRHL